MSNVYSLADYDLAAETIRQRMTVQPTIALTLGSGLSGLANEVEDAVVIPYAEIPGWAISTVAGHAGQLVVGMLRDVPVCVMQGRIHFYEGYSLQQVTFPVRVMKRLGIHTLVLTNAAGGVNPNYAVGDLMLVEDQINLVGMAGHSPLMGPNIDEFGPRFPGANRIYTKSLRDITLCVAEALGIPLQRGVYIWLAGPNFESPAEIRMLRILGADTVGMSTVPEAQVAHHAGMDVLAISTVTNLCIDHMDAESEPTHEEVQRAGRVIVPKLSKLLLELIPQIAEQELPQQGYS